VSRRSDELTAEIQAHLEKNRRLRAQLELNEQLILDGLSKLQGGTRMPEILAGQPIQKALVATDAAVAGLFDSRQKVRRLIIGSALDDGMSVEELATTFGVTPDRVRSTGLEQLHQG
jgi:DNA-directed RNA polymerase sigma subunit (sigma70/sigma32)